MNNIIEVKPEKDYKLKIKYKNEKVVVFEMNPLINKQGVFADLKNFENFKQVKVGPRGRSIEWQNGLDLCADAIWTKTAGEKIFLN